MRIVAQEREETPIADLNIEELSQRVEDSDSWAIAEQLEMLAELDSGEDISKLVDSGDLNTNALRVIERICNEDYKDNPICERVADLIRIWAEHHV